MPVSTTNSRVVYDALKACDVRLMSALPETWLVHLVGMLGTLVFYGSNPRAPIGG